MKNIFIFLFFVVISITFISSINIYLGDYGTDVKNLTADLVNGNLTIEIYDAATSGNQIYSNIFNNSIVNGSWNVKVLTSLEYGKIYYKNYKINGEDINFDGADRLEFSSPLGYINNVSTINFSLIDSCSAGSSIRLVYENGSVVCQTDTSGNGSSDLTNYALKNQSEVFSGNITTTDTGFFGWLGSLTSRITKLFVTDIDISNDVIVGRNVTATGNISASYFFGNGQYLTGLSSGTTYTHLSNFTDNLGNRGYTSLSNFTNNLDFINSSNLSGYILIADQRYNDTTLINSINSSLSLRIDGISDGNSSFNQSFTDERYIQYGNSSYLNNETYNYNQTILAMAYTEAVNNSLANWINSNFLLASIFNAENTSIWNAINGISSGNSSWNESRANGLYIAVGNKSIYDGLINNESYLSTYNSTYNTWAYNQTIDITNYYSKVQVDNNLTLYLLKTDQSFNETNLINSVNTSQNIKLLGFYNSSDVDSLLLSFSNSSFNQTLTDSLYYSINNPKNYLNKTQTDLLYAVIGYGDDWNKTYADTLYAPISVTGDNSSWNESRANLLYSNIQWNYNQTIPAMAYTDTTNNSLANWINNNFLSISNALLQYFNKTDILNQYYNKSDIDANNNSWSSTYNSTYATWAYNQTYSGSTYNETYNGVVGNLSYINNNTFNYNQTFDSTGYAKYQFTTNNFNGSGNFVTSGKVIVGTNTGTANKVDVSDGSLSLSTAVDTNGIILANNSGTSRWLLRLTSNDDLVLNARNNNGTAYANFFFMNRSNGFTSFGNGLVSPEAKLHIYDSNVATTPYTASQLVLEDNGEQYMEFIADAGEAGNQGLLFSDGALSGRLTYTHSDDTMHFFTSATEKLKINSSGTFVAGNITTSDSGFFLNLGSLTNFISNLFVSNANITNISTSKIILNGNQLINGYDADVCASGCKYSVISTALTTEGINKTIFVKRGIYSEANNITIQDGQNIYFDKVEVSFSTGQEVDMLTTGNNAVLFGDLLLRGDGYSRRLLDVRVNNVNAENLFLTIAPTDALAMVADTRQVFTWGNANRFNIKYLPFTMTSPNAGFTAQIFSTISQNSTYKIEIPVVTVTGGTGTGGVAGVVIGDDFNNIEVNVKYVTTATGNTGTCVNLIAGGDRNSVRGITQGCDATNLTNSGTQNNVAGVVTA